MYRPWKPLGQILKGDRPGFELTTKGRSLTVERYVWRNRVCVGGIRIYFEQSIAGLYVVDESVEVTTNYSAVPSDFDNSDPSWRGCELWLEENSSRIDLYGELGKVNYKRLNSYYMVGQDVVLVVDAESEPVVCELAAAALPTWERLLRGKLKVRNGLRQSALQIPRRKAASGIPLPRSGQSALSTPDPEETFSGPVSGHSRATI
jgi:hypothetical protein